jgi:hypothetical protein
MVSAPNSDYDCRYHGQGNGGHKDQNLVSQAEHSACQQADNCQFECHCTPQYPGLGTSKLKIGEPLRTALAPYGILVTLAAQIVRAAAIRGHSLGNIKIFPKHVRNRTNANRNKFETSRDLYPQETVPLAVAPHLSRVQPREAAGRSALKEIS